MKLDYRTVNYLMLFKNIGLNINCRFILHVKKDQIHVKKDIKFYDLILGY